MSRIPPGRVLVLVLALMAHAFPGGAAPDAEPLAPEDFAFGRPVEIETTGPLQTLLLDLPVYRGSVEARLADLRVMNAAGEPVPHAVRTLPEPDMPEAVHVALPFFELHAPEAQSAGAFPYQIRAELSETGAVLEIDSRPPAPATTTEASPLPLAYLVDASQLDAPVESLVFDLAEAVRADEHSGFVVPVRIEGSDDLARFAPIGPRAALARLEESGHRIEKRDVVLRPSRHRYLRVRFPADPLPVRVTGVRVRLAPPVEPTPRVATIVPGRPIADEPGGFLFDLGGRIPVDRAQVLHPETNSVLRARLLSAPEPDGPWQSHFDGLLYDLSYELAPGEGESIRNPDVALPVTRHRYLKLLVDGGHAGGTPRLEVRWRPEQLLFVTRGAAPYRLAYGRHAAPAAPFAAAELLAAERSLPEPLARQTARLGPQHALGDPSVLEPPPPPRPYRTFALWGVLLATVAVVLALGISLLRQIRADEPG